MADVFVVWIVPDPEGGHIERIFTNREKAKQYIKTVYPVMVQEENGWFYEPDEYDAELVLPMKIGILNFPLE